MAIIRSNLVTGYHIKEPIPQRVVQWSLDARRALILYRRIKHAGEDVGVKIFGTQSPNTRDHEHITPHREELEQKRAEAPGWAPDKQVHSFYVPTSADKLEDYVGLLDLDYRGEDDGYQLIKFPFIPRELEYNSESHYATIRSPGRNNPIYQYTGAEDKLEFEVDWYADSWGRREVIENCRRIEALSKGDGYTRGPNRVKLVWGNSRLLFSNHIFIVLAAPYRLTRFNKGHINAQGNLESTHMLPVQAYQQIVLGRVTSNNLSKVDIEFVDS